MADLDEGAVVTNVTQSADHDLSDEVQDFRFLASISSSTSQTALPRRGEKDVEPHGTTSQQNVLSASRAAMHEALSQARLHNPKSHIVATFDPKTKMTKVSNPKGQHFRSMGKADQHNSLLLLPEEALYMLERGSLDIRWAGPGDQEDATGLQELPMSLQSGYAQFVGSLGLTLERYVVFAGLRRSGYIVHRAENWYGGASAVVDGKGAPQSTNLVKWFRNLIPDFERGNSHGPLVTPGLYRSYNDIYKKLAIIPIHDPTASVPAAKEGDNAGEQTLHVCYKVWKPRPDFKKSAPGEPDFRVAVLDARDGGVPDIEQLDRLLLSTPYAPPDPTKQLYQKLKHGYRHVVLAVVDTGVVSYMRIADAGFGKEKVYERGSRGRGNKGGRGRGGRQNRGGIR